MMVARGVSRRIKEWSDRADNDSLGLDFGHLERLRREKGVDESC